MSEIERRELVNGVQIVWATPLSGYGHTADEQPMPYLQHKNIELTPRFGGEQSLKASGIESLPLPYGKLNISWPWKQRLFNLFRRNINIYWRNIVESRTRADRFFYFLEQLAFTTISDGFVGRSPLIDYSRTFVCYDSAIKVVDEILFKANIGFDELYLCPWAEFSVPNSQCGCEINPSLPPNCHRQIQSSTGRAVWRAHRIESVEFKSGDQLSWHYLYQTK